MTGRHMTEAPALPSTISTGKPISAYLKPVRIRDLVIPGNIFAAPCAGFSDWPERLLFKRFGCFLTVTEFVSIEGLCRDNPQTLEMLSYQPEELPLAAQIYGDEPERVPEAAQLIEELGYSILDINMGCPAKKVCRWGAGSALLKDPLRAEQMVEAAVKAVRIPVTVKMRTGFLDSARNAVEVAKRLEGAGASMIAVHGRTAQQGYSGSADWSYIAKVKEAVSVPLIGNGDVAGARSAKHFFEVSGVDGVMIGRAAIGNPWVFRDIIEDREDLEGKPNTLRHDFRATLLQHLVWMEERYGTRRAAVLFRKHAVKYVKGAPGATHIKDAICRSEDAAGLREIIGSLTLHEEE